MTALILNSGIGSRIKDEIKNSHKTLLMIDENETIIDRQLRILNKYGIFNIIMTTGYNAKKIEKHLNDRGIFNINFVYNEKYNETNYIYSIYKAKEFINDDILLLHGDLVFDEKIVGMILKEKDSSMIVSSKVAIIDKDFKAQIENEQIKQISIHIFKNSLMAFPLYKLNKKDINLWIKQISLYISQNKNKCYAEDALNDILNKIYIKAIDVKDLFISEIDEYEDLIKVRRSLQNGKNSVC